MSVSSVIEYLLIDCQIVASGLCCDNLGLRPYTHTYEMCSALAGNRVMSAVSLGDSGSV